MRLYHVITFMLYTDLNLKILRDDSACPGACQVIQWLVNERSINKE